MQYSAHRIFKRLNAYAKQNLLLAAIKEHGKIIKSGYILRYYDERKLDYAIKAVHRPTSLVRDIKTVMTC